MHDPKLYRQLRSDKPETRREALRRLISGDYLETFQRLTKGILIHGDDDAEIPNGCEAYWRVHEDIREAAVFWALFKTGKQSTMPSEKLFIASEQKYNNLHQVATSECTAPSFLDELADYNCLVQYVAENPVTPEETLEKLSLHKSKDVRRACVTNPNISPSTLFRLGDEFPQEILLNPIYSLLSLGNDYSTYSAISDRSVRVLARSSSLDLSLSRWIAANGSTEAKLCLLVNKNTTADLVDLMLNDGDTTVQNAAALHTSQPPPEYIDWISSLDDIFEAKIEHGFMKRTESWEPYFTIRAFGQILKISQRGGEGDDVIGGDPFWELNSHIPCDPYLPDYLLPSRIDHYRYDFAGPDWKKPLRTLMKMAYKVQKGESTADVLLKACKEENYYILNRVIGYLDSVLKYESPDSTVDLTRLLELLVCTKSPLRKTIILKLLQKLTNLIQDDRIRILSTQPLVDFFSVQPSDDLMSLRRVFAKVASPAVASLAADADPRIRAALAQNPSIDRATFHSLLSDTEAMVSSAAAIHSMLEAGSLDYIKHNQALKLAVLNLVNRNLVTSETLSMYSTHDDPDIRLAVARTSSSRDLLLRLVSDIPPVRFAIASNESVCASVAMLLAQDSRDDIREAMAANPSVPLDILINLSDDSSSRVRSAALANRILPVANILKIADNPDKRIHKTLAQIQNKEALQALASSKHSSVRLAVASNMHSPSSALAILADDEDVVVRSAAAGNPKTPSQALMRLSLDKSDVVNKSLSLNPAAPPEAIAHLDNRNQTRFAKRVLPLIVDQQLLRSFANFIHARRKGESVKVNWWGRELNYLGGECEHALAMSSHISAGDLEVLFDATNDSLICGNPRCPAEIMQECLSRGWVEYCFLNPALPENCVRTHVSDFARDLCSEIFAADGDLAGSGKYRLFNSPFRLFCLSRPECDPDTLHQCRHSINWLERFAIASNLSSSDLTLKELSSDPNQLVRMAASKRTCPASVS